MVGVRELRQHLRERVGAHVGREQPLFSDEIVFVMAADHPLAERAHVAPAELAAHTLIASPNTPKPEVKYFMTAIDRTLIAKRLKKPLRRDWRIAYRAEAAERARQLATALAGVAPRLYA